MEMLDRTAMLKTIEVLDREIETLKRARQGLMRQLDGSERSNGKKPRAGRGSLKAFLSNALADGRPKTVDDLMRLAEAQSLSTHRESLRVALHRGMKDRVYAQTNGGWIRTDNALPI